MKKLHAKEAQEIRLFEEEAAAKLAAAEHKLQSQFTKEELKAVRRFKGWVVHGLGMVRERRGSIRRVCVCARVFY